LAQDGHDSLGMGRKIDRRDFIQGAAAAFTVGAAGLGDGAQAAESAAPLAPDYYPPNRMGIRGNHPGSFESAHAVRDAGSWETFHRSSIDTQETYDLIVVGGGISGLASAWFYRNMHGSSAKILILDNHDDFGGHAKRNEFTYKGRTFIGYGGTEQIWHGPWEYSPEGLALLRALEINTDRFYTAFDWTRYARMQLRDGVFFDKEIFGRDYLAVGEGWQPWKEFLAGAPLTPKVKSDIVGLYENDIDYLPALTREEKIARLRKMTYNEFLLQVVKVDPGVIPYIRSRTDRDISPTDYLPVLSSGFADLPGLQGMGLNLPRHWKRNPEEIFHFPDGNAGVARMLVRSLIPGALIAGDMEEQVTARLDYTKLDDPASSIRLRVSSTVVSARHLGEPAQAKAVEVIYVNAGKAYRVRSGHVVMACYNAMIPFLCPGMPAAQSAGLSHAIKNPLVYTNVLVTNWRPWDKLGVQYLHSLSGYYTEAKLDFPVDLGSYKSSATPDEPIILHLEKRYWDPGPRSWQNPTMRSAAARAKMGRSELLSTSFEAMEREIRESLGRMLADGGFDPARDIVGITVNRWPHGYATRRDELTDPDWPDGHEPWVVGRQPFGRITIANSDAGAGATTQTAITTRSQGFAGWDMGVGKRWKLPIEQSSLQFRWEVFNVPNLVRFNANSVTNPP
jgi:spermidine dehydrogenase